MTTDPLRQAEAQLQRYWNIDGLHEIAAALIFVLTALWIWVSDVSPLPRAWKSAFSMTFPVLICGGMWCQSIVVKRIRRRLTYPRAGFAELRSVSGRKRFVTAAIAGLAAALLVVAIVRLRVADLTAFAVLIPGFAGGVFLWQLGSRAGIARFYVLAFTVAGLAVAVTVSGLPYAWSIVTFWSLAGAAMMVSGGLTLWRFLHTTPPGDE